MVERARLWLVQRRNARIAQAYQDVFALGGGPSPAAEIVLADLRRFCRIDASTFSADARTHALLEGRREVAQRIYTFLNIDRGDIAKFVEVQDE